MESIISNISTIQIILGCIILFIIFSPIAILSSKNKFRIKAEYIDELLKDGYESIENKTELIKKIAKIPNFTQTLNINVSEIYRKKFRNYEIYHFLHYESNTDGYSRYLRCVLIVSKINGLIPTMSIQPITIKNKLTMNLDTWKAPIILRNKNHLKSFKIRCENEEWFVNILSKSLESIIDDNCMRIGLAIEGNDNTLLGYLIGNKIEISKQQNATATCILMLDEIIKVSSIKYRYKKVYS
jgi:hypothetical protein